MESTYIMWSERGFKGDAVLFQCGWVNAESALTSAKQKPTDNILASVCYFYPVWAVQKAQVSLPCLNRTSSTRPELRNWRIMLMVFYMFQIDIEWIDPRTHTTIMAQKNVQFNLSRRTRAGLCRWIKDTFIWIPLTRLVVFAVTLYVVVK